MPLHVHHAHRAELLVDGLAQVLATPPSDAFAPDIVAVPSRGIERWIAQRLSHTLGAGVGAGDGVAANIDFPFPGAIIGDAVAHATGVDPATDPWRPERSVWPLLDVVTAAVDAGEADALGPLAAHVTPTGAHPSDRRFAAVERVAGLFDRYAVHRPAMLRSWADGDDVDATGGRQLPDRTRWQPWLWRRLRDRLRTPSGPERLADATAALAAGRTIDGGALDLPLPQRLSVFGLTSLSATTLEVLAALATGPGPDGAPRDVHVFLRHASPALWRRVAARLAEVGDDDRVAATAATALPARDHDPTREVARDPLLATWARDSRELQVVASTVRATWHDRTGTAVPDDLDGVPAVPGDATLLQRLQEAVAVDRPRSVTDDLPALAPDDRSVQVHRCHGPARQVEVLRDLVLHALQEDPDLQPRDVLVQCPDIETYAPLIEAVFARPVRPATADAPSAGDPDGTDDADGADEGAISAVRVQLADRALTRTNPLLRVVAEVLDLADGRVTAGAVLDLCTREPVRRRFAFGEDDLGTLDGWLTSTGIRWGLDGDHRDAHDVPTDVNTWRAGLDRLLAGTAAADERLRTVVGIAPEDDVEGDHVELAGRLAELVTRLHAIITTLAQPRPIGAWLEVVRTEVVGLLCAADPDQPWQELGLDRTLQQLRDAVRGTGADDAHLPLTLAEVRDLLGDRLAGAPSKAAHRTGELTVCTLVPMRSVPHEVVVWLGMDDEVFPRRTVPDGDDLLATAPLVGDRDPRSEDRQLLLDALLATRRRLLVLTSGFDERTGEARPPAVPVGELLDAVDRTVAVPGTGGRPTSASAAITVDHPLQPFDARRFTPGGLGATGRPAVRGDVPFGFDADDLDAAATLAGPRSAPRPFLEGRLSPLDEGGRLALADLTGFLLHPVQGLLSQRLDVTFGRTAEVRDDSIPVEPSALGGWDIGTRLLEQVVAGRHDPERWLEVERARGTLPPGDLADELVAKVRATVDGIVAAAGHHQVPLGEPVRAHVVEVTLDDGRQLSGSIPVVGDTRRVVTYSRLGYKHRLAAWVDLLALVAADPTRRWQALTLGRDRRDAVVAKGGTPAASVSVLAVGRTVTARHRTKSAEVASILGDEHATAAELGAAARAELTALAQLRDRGLCGPLLLPCDTAGGYGEAAFKADLGLFRGAPVNTAKKSWTTGSFGGWDNEDLDPAHVTVLGQLGIDQLVAVPPEPEEAGPGWSDDPSRLGRLARRVWGPLLSSEELHDLEASA